jgi:hypothetical protein
LIRRNWDWVTASNGLTTRISPAGERSRQQVNVGFDGTNSPPQLITLVNSDQRASTEIKIHISDQKIVENAALDTLTGFSFKAELPQRMHSDA